MMETVLEYPGGLRTILRHHCMMMMVNGSQSRQILPMAICHQDDGNCPEYCRVVCPYHTAMMVRAPGIIPGMILWH